MNTRACVNNSTIWNLMQVWAKPWKRMNTAQVYIIAMNEVGWIITFRSSSSLGKRYDEPQNRPTLSLLDSWVDKLLYRYRVLQWHTHSPFQCFIELQSDSFLSSVEAIVHPTLFEQESCMKYSNRYLKLLNSAFVSHFQFHLYTWFTIFASLLVLFWSKTCLTRTRLIMAPARTDKILKWLWLNDGYH